MTVTRAGGVTRWINSQLDMRRANSQMDPQTTKDHMRKTLSLNHLQIAFFSYTISII